MSEADCCEIGMCVPSRQNCRNKAVMNDPDRLLRMAQNCRELAEQNLFQAREYEAMARDLRAERVKGRA